MGIELLRGRPFTRADHVSELGNATISQSAAERLWLGENPIGRRFRPRNSETWETVVGAVGDVKQLDFRDEAEPLVYLPLMAMTLRRIPILSPAYVLKTNRADHSAPEVRTRVRAVAPNAPMYRAYTMEGLAADSISNGTVPAPVKPIGVHGRLR